MLTLTHSVCFLLKEHKYRPTKTHLCLLGPSCTVRTNHLKEEMQTFRTEMVRGLGGAGFKASGHRVRPRAAHSNPGSSSPSSDPVCGRGASAWL